MLPQRRACVLELIRLLEAENPGLRLAVVMTRDHGQHSYLNRYLVSLRRQLYRIVSAA